MKILKFFNKSPESKGTMIRFPLYNIFLKKFRYPLWYGIVGTIFYLSCVDRKILCRTRQMNLRGC